MSSNSPHLPQGVYYTEIPDNEDLHNPLYIGLQPSHPLPSDFLTGPESQLDPFGELHYPHEFAENYGAVSMGEILNALQAIDDQHLPHENSALFGSSMGVETSSLAHALTPEPERGRPTLPRLQIQPSISAPGGLQTTPLIAPPRPPTPQAPMHHASPYASPPGLSAPTLSVPHPTHVRRRSESSLTPMMSGYYPGQSPTGTVASPDSIPSPHLLAPERPRSCGDGRMGHGRSLSDVSAASGGGLLSPSWRGRDSSVGRASRSPSSRSSSRRSSPYPISRSVSPNPSAGGDFMGGDFTSASEGESVPVTPTSEAGGDSSPRPVVKMIVTSEKVAEASERRRRVSTDEARFKCEHCGRCLTSKHNLDGHMRSHVDDRPYQCNHPPCERRFSRKSDCKRHEETVHNVLHLKCATCDGVFSRKDALNKHAKNCALNSKVQPPPARFSGFHTAGAMSAEHS